MVKFDPNKIVELANTLVTGNPTGVNAGIQSPAPVSSPSAVPATAPAVPAPVPSQVPPPAPVAPPVPSTQPPSNYTVQAGDTASAIATRLGIPLSGISGFRSGNPNLIFPGETLNITKTPGIVPGQAPAAPAAAKPPAAPVAPVAPAPQVPTETASTFETEVTDLLAKFGIKPPTSDQSPFTAFANTYKDLYSQLGLSTVKERIESSTKSIEDLEAKKNEEIAEVNDNPFIAANIRAGQKRKIENKYEAKINALVNRLKLDQSLFESGTEDVQFIAQQALAQSKQGQQLTQDVVFKAIESAQKSEEARRKLEEPQKPTTDIQEFNLAKEQGFTGTFLDYKKAVAAAGRTPGLGGLTPAQQSAAFKIADDFEAASKTFFTTRDAYNRITSSATDPSAAGDLALIFNYMKLLDPGSVVREGEFATAENSAGVSDQIRAKYNKVISGERLAPNTRADFVDRAGKLFNSALKQQQETNKIFSNRAKKFGIPPEFVVRTPETFEAPISPEIPEAPEAPKNFEQAKTEGGLFNNFLQGIMEAFTP